MPGVAGEVVIILQIVGVAAAQVAAEQDLLQERLRRELLGQQTPVVVVVVGVGVIRLYTEAVVVPVL